MPRREADAIVVALKSRTIPAAEAIAQSLAACRWLKAAGARQFFFKYCSTFDSTDEGNIGPVADALLAELGDDFSIVCPAYPRMAAPSIWAISSSASSSCRTRRCGIIR